ncbi:MAG: hypothetical protein IPK26_30735 [Planctomycetes bacterium]|nr:hypothetical protein [Planctomycetota bacterium]
MRCHRLLLTLFGALTAACGQDPAPIRPADHNGLSTDPQFFPLAVWVQDPANGPRYRELGINTYVGLWQGPTREQLAELDRHGLKVVCAQNEVALAHPGTTILAWLHGDEPDNAQEVAGGGYGPPIEPAKVIAEYERLRQADRRPVMLNLSQGAAWDGWWGRGVRTNHPEDYAGYLRGCDLASFDIYPVTHKKPEVHDRLEFVGHGVRRLTQWSGGKPVFACIETTHIDNAESRPTPEQVRAEVWIAITCGARGITTSRTSSRRPSSKPGCWPTPRSPRRYATSTCGSPNWHRS